MTLPETVFMGMGKKIEISVGVCSTLIDSVAALKLSARLFLLSTIAKPMCRINTIHNNNNMYFDNNITSLSHNILLYYNL